MWRRSEWRHVVLPQAHMPRYLKNLDVVLDA